MSSLFNRSATAGLRCGLAPAPAPRPLLYVPTEVKKRAVKALRPAHTYSHYHTSHSHERYYPRLTTPNTDETASR